MTLNAEAISELTTETAPKIILAEWLSGWFDGQPHVVSTSSGVAHTFPPASIQFDQGPVIQTLGNPNTNDGLEIRVIIDPSKGTARGEEGGKLAQEDVFINFWVRVKKTQTGTGNSNYLANRAASLLVGILNNPDARYPMAQKGLMSLRARKAATYEDDQYALRHIRCQAQLQYKIRF